MRRLILIITIFAPLFASASSINAISTAKNDLDISNIPINDFADKISLASNAGWKKITHYGGVSRVRAGDGFIEGLILSECKASLALIDTLQKQEINKGDIDSYCQSLLPETAKTETSRRSIRKSLYNTAFEPFNISPFRYEAFNFKYPTPKLIYNPIKEKGALFTKKAAECTAQADVIGRLNHDRYQEILNSYSLDVHVRSICILDQSFGEKLTSAYVSSYLKAVADLSKYNDQ